MYATLLSMGLVFWSRIIEISFYGYSPDIRTTRSPLFLTRDNPFFYNDAYHRIRKDRVERKGKNAVQILPSFVRVRDGEEPVHIGGGAAAGKTRLFNYPTNVLRPFNSAIELVHELAEYLSRRYPKTFQITRHTQMPAADYPAGWDGEPPIKSVRIVHLQEEFDLPLPRPASEKLDLEQEGAEAMRIAGLLVQDDLALMVEGSDGGYYFMAGAILVPGFWRMRDKLGMRLDEIHLSGSVPQCLQSIHCYLTSRLIIISTDEEKLHTSLERFFRRLAVDKPVVRNNYFVQVSPPPSDTPSVDPDELAWGENVLGDEDAYGGTKGSSYGSPPVLVVTPQTLRLRTERQTLRRLPRSGAVVFTIRTYLFPVEELAREPGVAARFASAVRSWPEGVKEYKGERRYGDVLVRYLEEMAAREEGEPEEKAYPY
ncbi:hypothetical protein MVEN_01031300 [Mycena venus]|uniref:Uncharacterized protein n=1 Tax=Mycena venus TaxID=2733690 RepID=A0A8H7D329_9AGAR|nr:hypothetical protein MVEN_01031300 [Mycena venus]